MGIIKFPSDDERSRWPRNPKGPWLTIDLIIVLMLVTEVLHALHQTS